MLRSVTIFFKKNKQFEFVIFLFIYIFKRKCHFPPHIPIAVMEQKCSFKLVKICRVPA